MNRLICLIIAAMAFTLTACGHAPENQTLPYPFQALGNEPGWSVVLQNDLHAEVILDTGSTRFATTFTVARATAQGLLLHSTYQNQPLSLSIRPGSCNDTMSDTHYEYRAVLEIQGQNLQGCGRPAL